MPLPISPVSLYIHIPFCTYRCAYCDFNTYAGQEAMIPGYVDALTREIDFVGHETAQLPSYPNTAHTIFFGGGTPSLLSPKQFGSILKSIRETFTLTDDVEITIEANPGTVSYEQLLELRRIGINRISYGVQSANTEELRMLERAHSFLDVIEAVSSARKAGFDNLNLDLIYGLPEQTLQSWRTTLGRILDLHPVHISAYALTLEHGTPFGRWASRGLLPLPDPDLAAEMYECASETLEAHGYIQYEISNWAQHRQTLVLPRRGVEGSKDQGQHATIDLRSSPPGFACKHNLQYWRGLPYLAFGAGAHGYAHGYRYSNVLRIKTYIERLSNYQSTNYEFPLTPTTVNHHKQTLQDDMSEFMMTGFRLIQEGVSEEEFKARFGKSMYEVYGKEINELLKLGLIESPSPTRAEQSVSGDEAGRGVKGAALSGEAVSRGEGFRLTKRARLLGNQVFMRFVGETD